MSAEQATLEFLAQFDGAAPPAAEPPAQGTIYPYNGGEHHRLWRDWVPPHRAGDESITMSWDLLTTRVRDLFRNEPVIKRLKRELAKHVVGTGIATFADVLEGGPGLGEPDDDFNFECDDLFEHWAEEECDVAEKMSWGQMQWATFNEVAESGEAFLLRCSRSDGGRSIPLCYQLLEPEQVDWRKNYPETPNSNKIVRGVEMDEKNRPIAYWIFDVHPYDMYSGWKWESKRYPADRVIHVFLPNRPSENRGVTWFGANIQSSKDVDWLLGNELTASALGALLTLIIKRKSGAGSGMGFQGDASSDPTGVDAWGNTTVKLGRGIVADIGADDDIKIAESSRPNRDIAPFIDLLLMLHGGGVGLSKLRVTGDYKGSSYTAARAAHLDDQAFFVVLQQWFARECLRKVRREFTRQAAAFGLFRTVGARAFAREQARYQRISIQPPGREQLDPEKETAAAASRIRMGLSTWQDECGLRGRNWRRIVMQQSRERAFMKKWDFVPDLSTTVSGTKQEPGSETAGNADAVRTPTGSEEGDDA
jgi:lambda family phage portal protein